VAGRGSRFDEAGRRDPGVLASEATSPDAAAATTGASVLTGGLWTTASQLLPQLYTLVVSVVAARFLGPEGMGRQSFIAFTAISLTMLLTAGMPFALMRYIGETLGRGQPERLRGLLSWAWRVEGVAAAAGGAILLAVALLGADPQAAWVLAGVVCVMGILHTVPTAVLTGTQRFRQASVVGLTTGFLSTAAVVAVLAAGGGITGMFAVQAAVSCVNLAWTGSVARRALGEVAPRAGEVGELRRQVARYAAFSSISVLLAFVVWRRSELFFLEAYSSDSEIAFYSIAFAAVTALMVLPRAIATVISPAVATVFGAGAEDRIRTGYSRAARLSFLVALPVTAGALAVGPTLLRLVYGDDYSATGVLLVILVSTFPFVALINLSRGLLQGLGRLWFPVIAGAFAAGVNVGLDFLLIPRYDAVGAAVANSGAQLVGGLPIFIYAWQTVRPMRWEPRSLLRGGIAAAASGFAAWACVSLLGGAIGVLAGVVAGATVFLALAMALRILPPDDAAWLDEAVGQRLGGLVGRACRLCAPAPVEAAR